MIQNPVTSKPETNFIDAPFLRELSNQKAPSNHDFNAIIAKARELKGLSLSDAAKLLACRDPRQEEILLQTATYVKNEIYGKRMVIFAPLYTGNRCSNNCTYCAWNAAGNS